MLNWHNDLHYKCCYGDRFYLWDCIMLNLSNRWQMTSTISLRIWVSWFLENWLYSMAWITNCFILLFFLLQSCTTRNLLPTLILCSCFSFVHESRIFFLFSLVFFFKHSFYCDKILYKLAISGTSTVNLILALFYL